MDMVTGLAELLGTTPPEHKLEMVHLHFRCLLPPIEHVGKGGLQDVESHLRGANWDALDSTVVQITSSIKHPFKLSILLEYTVERRTVSQKARTKDEEALEGWGQRYLPRASNSPNLMLDVVTRYKERTY